MKRLVEMSEADRFAGMSIPTSLIRSSTPLVRSSMKSPSAPLGPLETSPVSAWNCVAHSAFSAVYSHHEAIVATISTMSALVRPGSAMKSTWACCTIGTSFSRHGAISSSSSARTANADLYTEKPVSWINCRRTSLPYSVNLYL